MSCPVWNDEFDVLQVMKDVRGVACADSRPSPPPPDPPKFLNPSFSNLSFWGKVLASKVPKNFIGLLRGYFFYPMCLSSEYSEFCGEFKNG